MEMGAMREEMASSDPDAEYRRIRRHETDGGVRLAGGRAQEAAFDQYSMSDGSTLPPPYSSDFGDS